MADGSGVDVWVINFFIIIIIFLDAIFNYNFKPFLIFFTILQFFFSKAWQKKIVNDKKWQKITIKIFSQYF